MQPNALNLLTQIQPVSKIEPISPVEMRTAFGGPLYQMLNPGTRQIVDNLGLRGQGVGGLAAMTFGPGKAKAPATIMKRVDKLIKKYKRQQNNYERELGNIPYDGLAAERAAQKEFQRLMKTRTELEMVLDRNRGFGLLKYTNDALSSKPKVPSKMYMTAPKKPTAQRVAPGIYKYRGFVIEDVGTNYGLPYRQWSFGKVGENASKREVYEATVDPETYDDAANSLKEAKEFIDRVYFKGQ
jgi:hypothetical protein